MEVACFFKNSCFHFVSYFFCSGVGLGIFACIYLAGIAQKYSILLVSDAFFWLLFAISAAYSLPVFEHERPPDSPKWRYLFYHRRTVFYHFLMAIIFLSENLYQFLNPALLVAIFIFWGYMFGIKINKKTVNFRSVIPKMKPFMVALVWCLVFSALFEHKNHWRMYWEAMFEIFFFIAGLTLTFEIRDGISDQKNGLKTLYDTFSEKKLLFFSFILVQISFCFGENITFFLYFRLFSQILLTLIYLLPFLLPCVLKKESFYTVLLDSSIGIVGFIYLCCS
jgi:hypothetical protein